MLELSGLLASRWHSPSWTLRRQLLQCNPGKLGPRICTTGNLGTAQAFAFPVFPTPDWQADFPTSGNTFSLERQRLLREWGRKREERMHRQPRILMDQMLSGSDFYPPRLLDDTWFTPEEHAMIHRLEALLQSTGHAHSLSRDMLTPLIYGTEVVIVLDDSGSMNLDMFGKCIRDNDIAATSYSNPGLLRETLQQSLPGGWFY